MTKYLIFFDAGYGEEHVVEDHDSQEAADQSAYENWKEVAESNATYAAKILTPELAEEYGVEDELEEG